MIEINPISKEKRETKMVLIAELLVKYIKYHKSKNNKLVDCPLYPKYCIGCGRFNNICDNVGIEDEL